MMIMMIKTRNGVNSITFHKISSKNYLDKLTSILVLCTGIENAVEKKKRNRPHLCLKLFLFSNTQFSLVRKSYYSLSGLIVLSDKISEIYIECVTGMENASKIRQALICVNLIFHNSAFLKQIFPMQSKFQVFQEYYSSRLTCFLLSAAPPLIRFQKKSCSSLFQTVHDDR